MAIEKICARKRHFGCVGEGGHRTRVLQRRRPWAERVVIRLTPRYISAEFVGCNRRYTGYLEAEWGIACGYLSCR